MNRRIPMTVAIALALLTAATAAAQTVQSTDIDGMSLEDLLKVEVVSIASKFPQEVREAPASITVVTAADIRRYGHRTLADVLRSVRGLYTTYDRNYSYAGIRGFSRPGDYNTRFLLLVDGYRLNDPLYDMAPIGTDFPLDVSLIDKVEVIRGPASSLYGTNAFFAVVNVVTRTGAQHSGVRAETFGGSLATAGGTVSYGRVLPKAGDLLVAGSLYRSQGASSLWFPEYADEPNGGLASHLDDDSAANVFASASKGRFSFHAGANTRVKQVPTAAFDTIFGDDRLETRDTRGYAGGAFEGAIGHGWTAVAKTSFDIYDYSGAYPYDYGDGVSDALVDTGLSRMVTGEFTLRRHVRRAHLLTSGVELRHGSTAQISSGNVEGETVDEHHRTTIGAMYLQDEYRVRDWLIVNAGGRIDHHSSFGTHVTPRAGVVFLPRPSTSIKVLYGQAFRAPNPYELFYGATTQARMGIELEPERVQSAEIVWEQYFSSRVRSTVTAYKFAADRLIEQRSVDDSDIYFVNAGKAEGKGLEGEIELKLPYHTSVYYNHAYAQARDRVERVWLSNSPHHLAKFGVQAPVAGLQLGVEGQYVGSRRTLGGEVLPGVFVPNATLMAPAGRRLELSLSVYNVFDARYSNPGAEEHRQQLIQQDGRTVLARARIHF